MTANIPSKLNTLSYGDVTIHPNGRNSASCNPHFFKEVSRAARSNRQIIITTGGFDIAMMFLQLMENSPGGKEQMESARV
jgi:hypothetical protein